jgi:hypothetical protein
VSAQQWYEIPLAREGEREGSAGFVQVLADSLDHAHERAVEQLRDVGMTPDADPSLRASLQRLIDAQGPPGPSRRIPPHVWPDGPNIWTAEQAWIDGSIDEYIEQADKQGLVEDEQVDVAYVLGHSPTAIVR